MAEAILVNRTRFTSSLKNELMKDFDILAQKTRIPKSRLLDEAIEDLLKKYEKRLGGEKGSRQKGRDRPCGGGPGQNGPIRIPRCPPFSGAAPRPGYC